MPRWLQRLAAPLAAGLLAAGCSDSPFGVIELHELADAEARWQARRPANYTVEERLSCFCGNARAEFTRLEVVGDSVVAATRLTQPPESISPLYWATVDDLFAMLHALVKNEGGYITDVTARYDMTWGVPTEIHVRCSDTIADCGGAYFARNFQPAP